MQPRSKRPSYDGGPRSSIGRLLLMVAIFFALIATGCVPVSSGIRLPEKPVALMQQCGKPAEVPEKPTMRDFHMAHADDVQTLRECSTDHSGLIQWVEGLYK